jgi:hypothetical protein
MSYDPEDFDIDEKAAAMEEEETPEPECECHFTGDMADARGCPLHED